MFNKLFGKNKGKSYQVPNNLVHEVFGEVNVNFLGRGKKTIVATILMDPMTEGTQTGVAIDGSLSMKGAFGQVYNIVRQPPQTLIQDMTRKGLIRQMTQDGQTVTVLTPEAVQPLTQQGYIQFSNNEVEPTAHDVIPYLAEKLDEDGGCSVIYWACGGRGDQIEVLGDLEASQVKQTKFNGPQDWGNGTRLVPAMRYFLERFSEAKYGFYVFITDGRLDDLAEVKRYTLEISNAVDKKQRPPAKGILIGVGTEVDESQMEELDDLPSPYDFWDHKIASTMRDLRDIFAEVVDENMRVAESGKVFDDMGTLIHHYSDGLPGVLRFDLPEGATSFRVQLPNGEIVQKLAET